MSLGALNGFELLLTGLWLLIQVFGFICTCDALLELEGGEAGDGEGLHIEPCLLSVKGEYNFGMWFTGLPQPNRFIHDVGIPVIQPPLITR